MTEINNSNEVAIWKLMNEQEASFFGGVIYNPLQSQEKAFAKKIDGSVDGIKNNAVSINEVDAWEKNHGKSCATMHLRSRIESAQKRSLASIVRTKIWIGTIDGMQNLFEKLFR